jgi:hypothetical protein
MANGQVLGQELSHAFPQGRVVGQDYAAISWRERPAVENRILTDRLENLLPVLMDETGFDMWLVLAREYAEDPVYFSLVPQPTHAARRTTMLVFVRGPNGLERLTVSRYPFGELYDSAWAGGDLEEQWQALGEIIREKNPGRIGINVSKEWPIADGLTHGLHQRLMKVLPPGFEDRVESAETLVIRWIETRTPAEMAVYPQIVALARQVIGEAFSNRVITPGVTTTEDVSWYIRERFGELQLPIWFQPDVNFQRSGVACDKDSPICGSEGVIQPGDVLHTDVGVCVLKLCTDTQEMGYVTRFGETSPPQVLIDALATGNQWQDDLTANFEVGRSGNQVLAGSLEASRNRGVVASTYTHPIGFFGHSSGPTIGMWDNQGGTPIRGEWPVAAMTAYAIEGNIKALVPEWDGQWVQIKLEQTALFDGERVIYVAGRQTSWHVVQ